VVRVSAGIGWFTVVLEVRGIVLPEREERSFWIDGGVFRSDPVVGADVVVDGGWLLPGLVDLHTHPGSTGPDDPFDDAKLRRDLTIHRDAGVLAVRTPGLPARLPEWVHDDPALPHVRSAGRWLATPKRFFPGYGRDVTEQELVAACREEASASDGWCKILGDWRFEDAPVPLDILTAAVTAVHDIGGRVAVHCQTADGCRNAVLAGADSLEHGMNLDPALLERMADQGTVLVPTLLAFASKIDEVRARATSFGRDSFIRGWDGMLPTVGAAYEAGVTVLAGTDTDEFGTVAEEVGWLVRAGVPAEAAVAAASWQARSWLGLAGIEDGASADLVAYDRDPTIDPGALARPTAIILRGRVVKAPNRT
jgi:imidazolonepropionase-like amidohydrolase